MHVRSPTAETAPPPTPARQPLPHPDCGPRGVGVRRCVDGSSAAPPPPALSGMSTTAPCSGRTALSGSGRFSSGNYGANSYCVWTLSCPSGGSPSIKFNYFGTETSYDR